MKLLWNLDKLRSNLDETYMKPRWNFDETEMHLRYYLDAAQFGCNLDVL